MSLFGRKHPKVLFVASEIAPFAKVGGLGEVMRSLPKALQELGCDARVMAPKYASSDLENYALQIEHLGLRPVPEEEDEHGLFVSNILSYRDKSGAVRAYFVENMEYYEKRANIYGYGDDAVRWALLCRAVLEFLKVSDWKPDVIVASDWQTGLLPNYLKTSYADDPDLSGIATVLTIHNLAYQASFDHRFVDEMDRDVGQQAIPALNDPRLLKLNFMRRGIMYADAINTVSEKYAQEIMTEEYGEGLDDLLRERASNLVGILNGISQDAYSPESDPHLEFNYSPKTLKRREKNRSVLRKRFNLPDDPNIPMLGIVSRLTGQKGFTLLREIGDALFKNFPVQLVVTGKGDGALMEYFQELAEKYPEQVAVQLSYDESLSRMIFGSADVILIPSKFEPSGLIQMEAMRYGAVPLVRATGGLADSVQDYDPREQTGTGFVFENFDPMAFFGTIIRALEAYRYPEHWKGIQARALKEDFSWSKSAEKYLDLFRRALKIRDERKAPAAANAR